MASKEKLIAIDLATFGKTLSGAARYLTSARAILEEAAGLATAQFGEFLLGEAGEKAPVDRGGLRESHMLEGPVREGDLWIVFAAYNIVYARMRDIGGEIKPVRAKALFIPLREGARPGDPTLVWGVDFVLAKKVKQTGNRYWSATLDEFVPDANTLIGKRAIAIAEARLGEGGTE